MKTLVPPITNDQVPGQHADDRSSGRLEDYWAVTDCKHVTAAFVDIGYPVVSIGEVQSRYVDLRNAPRTTQEFYRLLTQGPRQPAPGDLIMSRNASVGHVAQVADRHPLFAMGQDVCLLRRRNRAYSPDYLQFLLESPLMENQFSNLMAGSTFKRLNVGDIKDLRVAFPAPPIQASIGEALGNTEDQIEALERLIAKKQAIKQGMMQQLLTGMTRLPGYDSPWADRRLGDHVTYVRTVALSRAQLDAVSQVRYLHYGDIHTSSEVRLAAAERPMPRAPQALVKSAGRLQVGDLVFADASEDLDGVGKSVEVTSVPAAGVVPGLHTIAARFDKVILADGFKAYLQFIPTFRDALVRLAAGTKVLATTRSYISSITLTLPNVDEQRAIAGTLLDCDEEIAALRICLNKAKAVKQGMMQELLTGRTRLPVVEGAS